MTGLMAGYLPMRETGIAATQPLLQNLPLPLSCVQRWLLSCTGGHGCGYCACAFSRTRRAIVQCTREKRSCEWARGLEHNGGTS